jgi:hypothetical protein
MDVTDSPPWLTTATLAVPVRRSLRADDAAIEHWTCRPLAGGSSQVEGVWRVAGTACAGGASMQWSLILKGWPAPSPDQTEISMNWPLREIDLYRSGLLADLPGGISAPAYFGHERHSDGSAWIWLEDVSAEPQAAWPLERFATLARQLGQLNGAWAAGRPLPDLPSLSRRWIRERVESAAPFIALLTSEADHPLIHQVYPADIARIYERLWSSREAMYATLDQLPQAFCHLDAFPRNAFTRRGVDGHDQTVLIDWAFAGIAALGEELTSPIVASVMFKEVPVDEARHLEALTFEGYIDGLRDAGWRGDPDVVRRGYAIAAVLRYGVGGMGRWMPALLDERFHPIAERIFGHSFEEAVAISAAVQLWLADLVTET